ncbi:radical SAM protein [Candidatus Micrarchaeota archaeon]|nr:radical SAM protein [Candidatus Micrarchaeota archaeon]
MEQPFTPTYLIAPPCEGTMEGFPGALTAIKNYLDFCLGATNPSEILDLSGETSPLGELLKSQIPEKGEAIIGITVSTATYQNALHIARLAKLHNPSVSIVLGGHHFKGGQGEVCLRQNKDCVDYVCPEEGEKTIKALMTGKKRETVPNVFFFSGNKVIASASEELSLEEWNRVPLRLYASRSQLAKLDEEVPYISARGCGYRCSFCSVGREKLRSKSADAILRDLRYLSQRGNTFIAFEDNYFSKKLPGAVALAKKILEEKKKDPSFDFRWSCQMRLDAFDFSSTHSEALNLFFKAGLRRIYVGAESFDEDLLIEMGKTRRPKQYIARFVKNAAHILKKRLELGILLILGRPSETQKTEDATQNYLEYLDSLPRGTPEALQIYPSLSVLYPGTRDMEKFLNWTGLSSWDTIFEEFTLWAQGHRSTLYENFAHAEGGIPWGILNIAKIRKREFSIDRSKIRKLERHLDKLTRIGQINAPLKAHNHNAQRNRA